jgi:isopentenyl diphosphate isomerase/L-lactate dehydrogenase-like FMN-dependent dehydrogenase
MNGAEAPIRLLRMEDALTLDDIERMAENVMSAEARAYVSGGAGPERTLRWNREAFSRCRLRPRVLVDVSKVSTGTTVLGERIALPVIVAPTAFQLLVHPERELATARGAAAAGTIMCLSTVATASPAEVAEAAPGAPRWFQLYVFRDRSVTEDVLSQAVESGYSAVMLTVDLPVVGLREREHRASWSAPEEYVPSFVLARERGLDLDDPLELVDPSIGWDYLGDLCARASVPVVVKGILTGEDAALACEHGAAAIVVSNHGGRQLDGASASLDALPEVVEAVSGRAEVYVDGGIRRGTDVLTAIALGAKATLVGRPVLHGLALDGEQGVRRVLDILRAEIENGLALLGCRSPAEITAAHVKAAGA